MNTDCTYQQLAEIKYKFLLKYEKETKPWRYLVGIKVSEVCL